MQEQKKAQAQEAAQEQTQAQEQIRQNAGKKKRIEIIDALRGLSVILMVAHHLLYNLAAFLGAPWWLFTNPVFDVLHYIFAGLFIFLSGVSSRLSHSNIKRGAIAFALAMGITAVTWYLDMPIWFGVLHLLGFCMLFFGVTRPIWDAIPRTVAPFLYIALLITGVYAVGHFELTTGQMWSRSILWILGWQQRGFVSFDYFPLIPWLFVFLTGTWAGLYIKERKLPGWFYEVKPPLFPAVGRKALIIYVLHQPVLYGLVIGIKYMFKM